MDSSNIFRSGPVMRKEDSGYRNLSEEDEETLEQLRRRIQDLESQLEYEIKRHDAELTERDNKIRKLEKTIEELENNQSDSKNDEAVLQMSEKLLLMSNKYDELVKEQKLKEEELNHLKTKKKYRNDKTNNFIMSLKKEIEDKKKDYQQLNEKYIQLQKDMEESKKAYIMLKQKKVNEEKILMESKLEEKQKQEDEENALRILNMQNGISNHPILKNKGKGELSSLRMELKYKDMIIQKLIKNKVSAENTVSDDTIKYADEIKANEKKIEQLYNKYLDAQSDSDRYRKQIDKMKNEIKYLKDENALLIKNFNDLKTLKSSTPKNQRRISEFGDLLDNVMKENTILNKEISIQKRKNLRDVYYYNKEIELVEKDKFKIIEKFDHKNVVHVPHLYEPLHVTLSVKDDVNLKDGENENCRSIIRQNTSDSEEGSTKQGNKDPIVMDDLVHLYITDYMKNVLNKK